MKRGWGGRISPLSLQETVEPEGKLDKAVRPQSHPKIYFLLDIGQSRIYSTRIAAFNAGRINSKQAYQEWCISPLSGFPVADLLRSSAIFFRRGVLLIIIILFSPPGEKAGSTRVRCARDGWGARKQFARKREGVMLGRWIGRR